MTFRDAPLRSHLLMMLLVLLVGLINFQWGEKITVGGGFGSDGIFYGALAKDFYIKGIDAYRMQRIVPSAVIHYTLRALRVPLVDRNIITAFELYNLLLLLLGCYLWKPIADRLALSIRGRWLGFIGLFVNYATLKWAFYYPVATDVSAFVLGMFMLLFFLKGQTLQLFIVTLVGAFTWPVIIYGGIILILFPNKAPEITGGRTSWLSLLAILPTALLAVLIIYFYYVKGEISYGTTAPIVQSLAPLSIAATLLYVFLPISSLLGSLSVGSVLRSVRGVSPLNAALALAAFTVARTVPYVLGDREQAIFSTRAFLEFVALNSITRPFISFVAHVVYFGPIVILFLFLWGPFCQVVRQHGLGLVLFIALSVFISVAPESRQSINAYPFFIALLAKACEGLAWERSFYWLLGLTSLVFSKIWFPLNVGRMEGSQLEFPLQYSSMSHGSFMSNLTFLVQGTIVLLTGLLYYRFVRRAASPDGA